jgi:hypothetical protein
MVLNITSHWEMRIEPQLDITSYLLGWSFSKTETITSIGKDVEKMEIHSWWGCKLVLTLWKTVWISLKKLKLELHDPAISLLGSYSKEIKSLSQRNIHCSFIHNTLDMETTQVSFSR